MAPRTRRLWIQAALFGSAAFWAADTIYRIARDITFANREQCVLFRALPKPAFLLFENMFETIVIVFMGTFIAVWLGRQFLRLRRFFPHNPMTAFLYGATLPICACGVIPIVSSMKGKLRFSTVVAFIIAAPALSPYIIALSFSVLGPTYGVLRIASAFVLTMVCACVLGFLEPRLNGRRAESGFGSALGVGEVGAYVLPQPDHVGSMGGNVLVRYAMAAGRPACAGACPERNGDLYLEAFAVFRKLLPYLVLAGLLGLGLEYLGPRRFLQHGGFGGGLTEVVIWTLVGVPLYFCNGAEVFFLRPLVGHGFPIGTAIAFSLTSTAVCASSLAMLYKIIGGRLTAALAATVAAAAIGLALLLNAVF